MLLREYNLCYDYDPPLPHSSQSGWRAAGWTKMATSHPRLLASLGFCQNSDRRSETYDFLTIVLRSRNLSFFLTMDVFISLDSIRTFVPSLFFDSSVNLAGLQVAGLAGRLAGWQADRQAGRQAGHELPAIRPPPPSPWGTTGTSPGGIGCGASSVVSSDLGQTILIQSCTAGGKATTHPEYHPQ